MKHTKLPRALTGLLLAGLLVAACAEPDGNDSGAGGGATTVPTTLPGNPPARSPSAARSSRGSSPAACS